MKNTSLIICAYNEEKSIAECLNRAIKASHGNFFEILVINNASTDTTKTIAECIPTVRVIDEPQKGLTKARQCGFEHAKGELLAFIDADTRMPSYWFDMAQKEFDKNPNLVCLSGPYQYFDIPKFQQFLVTLYWYILALPMYHLVGYMAVGGNFVIKRETLEKMHGFDTTVAFYGEDTNIARRAHMFGKVKMHFAFVMPTSGRRLSGDGVLMTSYRYMINFLSEVLLHKPVTSEYRDIR